MSAANLIVQPRDIALLCGLFESRIMTSVHAAALYFDGKDEYAKKRLQKLKAVGFVAERKRRVNERSILFLTRKAFYLLRDEGHLAAYPALSGASFESRANVNERTLRHELDIMDVKTAFHRALLKSDRHSIVEFTTWPLLCQFTTPRNGYGADVLVKPDGFIRIHEKEEGTKGFSFDCFLEVDRSSKDQTRLTNQAACYLDYYRFGGFAVRNGAPPVDFKEFPFRVLMVLTSYERRNNTAERLLQNTPPILTQTWLTTVKEVTADPLGAIWMQPVQYRDAVKGTRFDAGRQTKTEVYRRNTERDDLVEGQVQKLRLLED
jgi:hypothetical protein